MRAAFEHAEGRFVTQQRKANARVLVRERDDGLVETGALLDVFGPGVNRLPYAIYTDQAGWLAGSKRAQFTQFQRACEELGTRLIPAYSPQAKGRIERAWDTFQDRIVPEMRLRKIRRLPAANTYLREHFLPGYWRQNNVVTARELEPAYRPLDKRIDLKEVLCLKEWRSVQADQTISYDGKLYWLDCPTKYSLWKQKVELRTYQDLTQRALFADRPVQLTPIAQPQRPRPPMRATG